MSSDFTDNNLELYFYLNLVLLLTYVIPVIVILVKLGFKLDRACLFNISIYTCSFSIKAVIWLMALIIKDHSTVQKLYLLDVIAAFAIDINLYFFVYEMMAVYVLLRSNNPQEFAKSKASAIKYKKITLTCSILGFLIAFVFYFIRYFFNYDDVDYARELIFQLVKIFRMVININLLFTFCKLFVFFIRNKKKTLEQKKEDFTSKHKMVVAWTVFVVAINFFNEVLKCFIYLITLITEETNTSIDNAETYRFISTSIVNYIDGVSILYVIYCMGTQQSQSQLNEEEQQAAYNQYRPNYGTKSIKRILQQRSKQMSLDYTTSDFSQSYYDNTQSVTFAHDSVVERKKAPIHQDHPSEEDNSSRFKIFLVSQISWKLDGTKQKKIKKKLYNNL